MKKYTLPSLPYDFSALEPVISKEIMQLHYEKHHNAYVTNLNAAIEKYDAAEAKEDLDTMVATLPAIKFNGGGHVNHSIFWTNLAPAGKGGGGNPKNDLSDQIKKQFGSFDSFVEKFNSIAVAIQGSGWAWLAFCPQTKSLRIPTCQNQDPLFATTGMTPLLGIDVWEHAYYLQYKNARADYLKAIWKVVNWGNVESRFEKACETCAACK